MHRNGCADLACRTMWKPELLAEWARVYPATRELYLSYCEDHAFSNAPLEKNASALRD